MKIQHKLIKRWKVTVDVEREDYFMSLTPQFDGISYFPKKNWFRIDNGLEKENPNVYFL